MRAQKHEQQAQQCRAAEQRWADVLSGEFEDKYTYYKGVIFLENLLFSIFVTRHGFTSIQLCGAAGVTVLFSAAFAWTRPYTEDLSDRIEMGSRVLLIIEIGLGLSVQYGISIRLCIEHHRAAHPEAAPI